MTAELAVVGSQCRGERHEQVIARQRDALVELRAKIRVLETTGNNPRNYTFRLIGFYIGLDNYDIVENFFKN